MDIKQKELLKKKVEGFSLEDDEPESFLELAADVCRATAEMLQETEPYATNSIRGLRASAETMDALAL